MGDGYVSLKHALAEVAVDAIARRRGVRLAGVLAAYARRSSGGAPVSLAAIAGDTGTTPSGAGRLLLRTGLFAAADGGRTTALSPALRPFADYFYRQVTRLGEALRLARSPRPSGVSRVIWNAIAMFNAGLFFECHEYLEDAWRGASEPERTFYHGLVQASAGLYHLEKRNLHGARVLLGKAVAKLRPYAPAYRAVDVAALADALEGVLAASSATPPRLPDRRSDLPAMRLAAGVPAPAQERPRRPGIVV